MPWKTRKASKARNVECILKKLDLAQHARSQYVRQLPLTCTMGLQFRYKCTLQLLFAKKAASHQKIEQIDHFLLIVVNNSIPMFVAQIRSDETKTSELLTTIQIVNFYNSFYCLTYLLIVLTFLKLLSNMRYICRPSSFTYSSSIIINHKLGWEKNQQAESKYLSTVKDKASLTICSGKRN